MSSRAVRPPEKQSLPITHAPARQRGTDGSAFQFVDRRPETAVQRKLQDTANNYSRGKVAGLFPVAQTKAPQAGHEVHQLRPNKIVTAHARTHYNDGWGAQYGIMDDATLKSRVSNSVTGSGSVALGEIDAPDSEQDTPGRIKSKPCSIGYQDSNSGMATVIFACGPYGAGRWRNA